MTKEQSTTPKLTLAALLPDQWALLADGSLVMRCAWNEAKHRHVELVVLRHGKVTWERWSSKTACWPLQSVTVTATWSPLPGG